MGWAKLALAVVATLGFAQGHSRLNCPPARDMNGFASTAIKTGPCGSDTNDFNFPSIEVAPGPFTIHVLQSIRHEGESRECIGNSQRVLFI